MAKANGKSFTTAVAYLRRSTEKQEASLIEQRKAIKEYAKENGYKIVRWYEDDGVSGDDTEKRLDFLRMLADAEEKSDFKAILCWDQDRFGRFSPHEASYRTFPLAQAGIRLVTVNRGVIDWSDFTQWLMYSVHQHGKHEFLKDLSRNVCRGQIEAQLAGGWNGAIPLAYRIEGPKKKRRLVLGDVEKQRVVERIFHEFVEEGHSMTSIADRLNKNGIRTQKGNIRRQSAIKTILENHVYIGTHRWGMSSSSNYNHIQGGKKASGGKRGRHDKADWMMTPNVYPSIVSEEIFNKAQAILAKGKHGRSPYTADNNPFLFTGKLRCGRCGETLWGEDSRRLSYECSRAKRDGDCEGTRVREDTILEFLSRYIREEYPCSDRLKQKAKRGELKPSDVPKSFSKLKRIVVAKEKPRLNTSRIKKQIQQLETKIAKGKRNLTYVDDPEFIPVMADEIRNLEQQRQQLRQELTHQTTEQDINAEVLCILSKLFTLNLVLGLAQSRGKTTTHDPSIPSSVTETIDRWVEDASKDKTLKQLILDIDHIKVYTENNGRRGNGRRYIFERGELVVRGVAGNSNPDPPG